MLGIVSGFLDFQIQSARLFVVVLLSRLRRYGSDRVACFYRPSWFRCRWICDFGELLLRGHARHCLG